MVDTINKLFLIEDNENEDVINKKENYDEKNEYIPNTPENVHIFYDGNEYYTFLNIYKDGKFLEKKKISSLKYPINWRYIISEILNLNKHNKYYGFVYKLSYSWNKGYILETTEDVKYYIDYDCNNN